MQARSATWPEMYARCLAGADLIAIVIAAVVAHRVRFGGHLEPSDNLTAHPAFSVILVALWMTGLSIANSRAPRVIGAGSEEYRQVLRATALVFGGVGLLSLLFKAELSRGYLLIVLPAGLGLLLLFRWLARALMSKARKDLGLCVTRLIVVGNLPAVSALCASLSRVPCSEYRVAGVCVPDRAADSHLEMPGIGMVPNFGDESHVVQAIEDTGSTAVAVTGGDRLSGGGLGRLSWELEDRDVALLVAPAIIDVAAERVHMRPNASLPLIQVEKPQYRGAKRFKKRFFDVAFSGLVLIAASPIMLAIAAVIKLTSKGPVFYRSERIGMDGRPFQMLKFRTMVQGSDAMIADLTGIDLVASPRDPLKFRGDPRVTAVGRILRKHSLDELPQFINVIKRDMSVVGPRPQVEREVSAYDDEARRRLLVRPGITGMWQVNGRSDLSWEDSVRLDLFYVENWSMTADFFISLKTVRIMFGHSGAY